MGDLTSYTPPSNAVGVQTASATGARSTASTSFGETVIEWEDLPAETRSADEGYGTLLTTCIRIGTGYARKVDGTPHQVMTGFRAYLDRLIIVELVRPLTKRTDGALQPAGNWRHHQATVYKPTNPPVRTRGTVPAGIATGGATSTDGQGDIPAPHRTGAQNFALLPAAVRATAARAVPSPKTWVGQIVQWTSNKVPIRQAISNMRMDPTRAVVVYAERGDSTPRSAEQLAALDWQVTQLSYDLTSVQSRQVGTTRTRAELGN